MTITEISLIIQPTESGGIVVVLVRFTVSNFRSFDQKECFSMEAGKTRSFSNRVTHIANEKVLKFKAVYGANASGKSNLVRAIDFMQYTVLNGIPADASLEYCRMTDGNIDYPSCFEIEVVLDKCIYIYGFEALLSAGTFVREWLCERKGTKSRVVFSRDVQDGTYDVDSYVNDSALNDRLRIYAEDIRGDSTILFLRTMNQNKDSLYSDGSRIKVYRTLYRWFKSNLSVNHPDEPVTQYTYFFDSQASAKAEELLSRLDTGISKVIISDEPAEKVLSQFPKTFCQNMLENLNEQKRRHEEKQVNDLPAVMIRSLADHSMYIIELKGEELVCKTLKFNHAHSSMLFSLREESDGTIRLLDLLEVLLSNAPGMVYVIDEVSRCLHPLLTKQFVRDYLDLAVERNIQLIITTHESELLDLELLRQDEIGFVSRRKENGTSRVFDLSEFGARFDKRIRKAYLDGLYGAIPRIDAENKRNDDI